MVSDLDLAISKHLIRTTPPLKDICSQLSGNEEKHLRGCLTKWLSLHTNGQLTEYLDNTGNKIREGAWLLTSDVIRLSFRITIVKGNKLHVRLIP